MFRYTDGIVPPLENLDPSQIRPIRRVEYDRLVELGVFDEDERIELLRGVLVKMSPQGSPHAWVVQVLNKLFTTGVGDRAIVRPALPFAASDDSEPEPDLAVVPPENYRDHHPDSALLIVEVADSSLRKDRIIKADIYAEGNVREYWIVNVDERVLEIHRDAAGGQWHTLTKLTAGETVSPIAFPELVVNVADILP